MYRILLVEDDKRVGSFISKGLEEHAFQVKVVHEGYLAIQELM